jgi:hypothetical protein
MRWESSESSPFSDRFCVDNHAYDGQPTFDHSAKHYDHDDPGSGSTSCAEL